jgi:microcystin-dependent protein
MRRNFEIGGKYMKNFCIAVVLMAINMIVLEHSNCMDFESDDRDSKKRMVREQSEPAFSQIMPIGSVVLFAGKEAPPGWLMCHGQQFKHYEYLDLYKVIGNNFTPYGMGDFNPNIFCIPDMRGRVPVGEEAGSKSQRVNRDNKLGSTGGKEDYTQQAVAGCMDETNVRIVASADRQDLRNNMPPYLVLNYIIKH